jgi:hypothetical protein
LKLFLDKDNAGCPKLTIRCLKKMPFSITGFKSTGGCITAEFDPSVNAPEHVLEPKVDTDKLSANPKGHITIGVTHTDGKEAFLSFEVVPNYMLDPQVVSVTMAEPGKPIVRKISVLNNYGDDFEIESVTGGSGNISAKVLERRKVSGGYQLDVELTVQVPEDQQQGRFMGDFSVKIKGGEEILVPCRGYYSRKKRATEP